MMKKKMFLLVLSLSTLMILSGCSFFSNNKETNTTETDKTQTKIETQNEVNESQNENSNENNTVDEENTNEENIDEENTDITDEENTDTNVNNKDNSNTDEDNEDDSENNEGIDNGNQENDENNDTNDNTSLENKKTDNEIKRDFTGEEIKQEQEKKLSPLERLKKAGIKKDKKKLSLLDKLKNKNKKSLNSKVNIEAKGKMTLLIMNFCSESKDMEEALTNNMDKFKDILKEYEGIAKTLFYKEVTDLKKELDQIVGQNCSANNWDNYNMELLAEQIRRNDVTTITQKKKLTEDYMKKFYNPVLEKWTKSTISKDDFVKATMNFEEGSKNPFYSIFSQRYNWNKIINEGGQWFKPKDLEDSVVSKLASGFDSLLKKQKITKDEYKNLMFAELKVKDVNEFKTKIENKFDEMIMKYNLKDYMDMDRDFNHEERKNYVDNEKQFPIFFKKLLDNPDFIKDAKEVRLMIYQMICFGQDDGYSSSKKRVKEFRNGGGIQSLFRMARYIEEPFTINLELL